MCITFNGVILFPGTKGKLRRAHKSLSDTVQLCVDLYRANLNKTSKKWAGVSIFSEILQKCKKKNYNVQKYCLEVKKIYYIGKKEKSIKI